MEQLYKLGIHTADLSRIPERAINVIYQAAHVTAMITNYNMLTAAAFLNFSFLPPFFFGVLIALSRAILFPVRRTYRRSTRFLIQIRGLSIKVIIIN